MLSANNAEFSDCLGREIMRSGEFEKGAVSVRDRKMLEVKYASRF